MTITAILALAAVWFFIGRYEGRRDRDDYLERERLRVEADLERVEDLNERLRAELAASSCCRHLSDCAVHAGPAFVPGRCSCGAGGVCPNAEVPAHV